MNQTEIKEHINELADKTVAELNEKCTRRISRNKNFRFAEQL